MNGVQINVAQCHKCGRKLDLENTVTVIYSMLVLVSMNDNPVKFYRQSKKGIKFQQYCIGCWNFAYQYL